MNSLYHPTKTRPFRKGVWLGVNHERHWSPRGRMPIYAAREREKERKNETNKEARQRRRVQIAYKNVNCITDIQEVYLGYFNGNHKNQMLATTRYGK